MEPIRADVLVQAGHEGRTTGKLGGVAPWGREMAWTPVVANRITEVLQSAGLDVLRVNADEVREKHYLVTAAVYIHFDAPEKVCSSGASIGYPAADSEYHHHGARSADAAAAWRELYRRYIPYRFMPDNFTRNLLDYYAFGPVDVTDSQLVLEMGELTCKRQADWMQPRLLWMGELVAWFLTQRIGRGDVPLPSLPD